jgi:hypothetical protein
MLYDNRIPFDQSLDKNRPHKLLTKNSKRSGCLTYQYLDTDEKIIVPNIWYNQTYQTRVEAVRWEAKQCINRAESYEKRPPVGMSKENADNIAKRYRERAARIFAEADRMEAAGDDAYPVKASLMQLDYGENAC